MHNLLCFETCQIVISVFVQLELLQQNSSNTWSFCHSGICTGHKKIQYVDSCSVDNIVLALVPKNIHVNFIVSLFQIMIQRAN